MRFKEGVVVSTKMNKTVKVVIERLKAHPKYKKRYKVSTKLYAHNENPDIKVGDKVTVMEVRPMSKLKRWKVISEKEQRDLTKEKAAAKQGAKVVINLREYTIQYKKRKKKVRKEESAKPAAEAPVPAPEETPPTETPASPPNP
ncbi:MAG: 30S ribosomal protein S17 [Candidatus Abawacabacteria bacterium RBG_16_42_10]|uniref:Small ribosomal subunit protein uS17 n=1 Tax=Candidatus Abawacabacteria bacterium RBG_16_42_10 TaxID=1817814 RepID=A0A1F4XIH5_9BACT|nr:ribosomal protein S17 [uncultured bacterium]OGC81394.1 MAG: 30S ribosomal protein S17 [Candidatus Abawacabacteria bacterium RBG_16_42_10]